MLDDLRERLLTPAGARAVTHPIAVVGAGVVAAGTVVAGAPFAVAGLAGAAVWGAVVARKLPPSRRTRTPDLRGLQEPWRRYLVEAVAARQRFDTAVGQCDPGPLRRRLELIGRRVEDGVAEVDRIARRGSRLDGDIRELEDPDELRERLERVRAEPMAPSEVTEPLDAQLASTERIVRLAVETRQRLEVLDAQLDEAVAGVVELSRRQGDAAEADALGNRVDGLVGEMESLRLALDESGAESG